MPPGITRLIRLHRHETIIRMRHHFFLLVTLITVSGSILADPLFEDSSIIEINLAADFSLMISEKDKSKRYPAKMLLKGEALKEIELEVRGNYRLLNCQTPGFRLVFDKKQKEGLFDNQKKLKLVVPCRKRSQLFQDYIYQEYAVYRAYEVLTQNSFKTRLVKLTYVDTGSDTSWTNHGFLIEDKARLAKRLGLKQVKEHSVRHTRLAKKEGNLAVMYQYLIGNTDFSYLKGEPNEACCHNAKLYQKLDEPIIPVPYDFDLAGIIKTRYSKPAPDMGIKNVTQRKYRGVCENNDIVRDTIAHMKANQDALYTAFLDEHISEKRRKNMVKFLDRFFDYESRDDLIDRKFTSRCR